ncbi:MAG: magnesium transporter [Actinomycetota bacterium]|nr:MAG: magnesium transporter [Actinomycetota bacterium]
MSTGAPSRIFLARLAGVGVFEPDGDQVGRIRDVVVTLRSGQQQPRVLGLVVEVQPRRRIFVPIGRVTSIDPGAVVVSGMVNLKRFEQRDGETLVMAEIFDRHVTLADTAEQVTVMDVGIEADRSRDWLVTRLYVRPDTGRRRLRVEPNRLRRRADGRVVEWGAVRGLSAAGPAPDQGASHLLATIEKLRPADLANVLHELSPKRRLEVARALHDQRLADVLEELPDDDRVEILGLLEAERAADVLEEMDPDDAADLLGELSPEQADRLLALIEPDEAADLRRLLAYDDDTAGGMMTTEPVVLPPDATVAEALARVRNPDLSPSLAAQVYVVRAPVETPTGKYLGVAHFQRLLREPPAALVSAVVDNDLEPIGPDARLGQVARYFATYNLVALPVVDAGDHLLGAVTVDDVVDHMLPEGWRDPDIDPDDDPDDVDDDAAGHAARSTPGSATPGTATGGTTGPDSGARRGA